MKQITLGRYEPPLFTAKRPSASLYRGRKEGRGKGGQREFEGNENKIKTKKQAPFVAMCLR